jgi:hypothetical protein
MDADRVRPYHPDDSSGDRLRRVLILLLDWLQL